MTDPGSFVDGLPRTTLIVGKGGVGKTTCAAGLAAHHAESGARTLVVSTDPAQTLADLIAPGPRPAPTIQPVAVGPRLDAWLLDTAGLRNRFLDEWRETIGTIIDRGTYLDRDDVDGLIEAALPGADEIFAVLALGDAITDQGASAYERIVIDTAPTGHTLRLLDLPSTFRAIVALLDTMQDKHRFMVRALTHRYRRDRGDEFIDRMLRRVGDLIAALADSSRAAALLVSRPEPVVIAESVRYLAALRNAGIAVGGIVVNVWTDQAAERRAILPLQNADPTVPLLTLPRLSAPPTTLASAQALVGRLAAVAKPARAVRTRPRSRARTTTATPVDRELGSALTLPLTIVAGKGGVGKTTVACALGIASADAGERVLLVSTDPAPSIADALDQAIGDEDHAVDGVRGLTARQMDAAAAFGRFRDEYQTRIDALFDGLVGGGLDASYDRAVLRDLLMLSPPGIDELYAISVLGEALDASTFTRVIVDPAPTGHLLRLLDMLPIALEWSHRLMRLLLKYQDLVHLDDAGAALLAFARRTRRLGARLHDPAACGAIAVLLDESVVRAETTRLVGELRAREIPVRSLIWNRIAERPAALPVDPAIHQVLAEAADPPPIGVSALRRWSAGWTQPVP